MNILNIFCKNTVSRVTAISIVAVTLSACSEVFGWDYEVDWAPVILDISVEDQYGNDLLNPEYPGNIVEGSSITFQGTEYDAVCDLYEQFAGSGSETDENPEEGNSGTKAYIPRMGGFILMNGEMSGNSSIKGFFMRFGEIDGAADLDEKLVIKWGDGSRDEIRYVCKNHKEGRNPSCNRYFYLNGTQVNTSRFYIEH
ncbi:MAG: hypothetical protein ACI399_01290 [Candidatus Cryptobacteroides sp.]